jgi:hypothetical protein
MIDGVEFCRFEHGGTFMNRHSNHSFGAISLGVASLLMFGCGGGSPAPSASSSPSVPTLSSIQESPSGAPVQVGNTQQFTATGTFSDGSTKDISYSVSWKSSDTAVATINSTGLVTAAALGNSTITATSGSITSTGAVIVTPDCASGAGSLSLGTAEDHILSLNQFGTEFTPDEHMTYLRQPDGSVRLWIAGGTAASAGETIGFSTNDLVNLTPLTLSGGNAVAGLGPSGPGTENFDADYAGPGSVFPASNGTDLLMIYHAENHEFAGQHYVTVPFYASIGLARSTDNGATWTSMGAIITGMTPKPVSFPTRDSLGAGNPTAITANGYIYVFYVDWNLTFPDSIYVARAPVSSDGAQGSWEKYYNGSFSQPGLGGLSSAVQGPPPPSNSTIYAGSPDVSYNTFLQTYLLLLNSNVGWHYATSPDLLTWTIQPTQIFTIPTPFSLLQTGDTWYDYPTLISPEENSDQTTTCGGYVYYTKGTWNQTPQTMYRLPFTVQ